MIQIAVEYCCSLHSSVEHVEHRCTICEMWSMPGRAWWVSRWPDGGNRLFLCNNCKDSGAGDRSFMFRLVELKSSERL